MSTLWNTAALAHVLPETITGTPFEMSKAKLDKLLAKNGKIQTKAWKNGIPAAIPALGEATREALKLFGPKPKTEDLGPDALSAYLCLLRLDSESVKDIGDRVDLLAAIWGPLKTLEAWVKSDRLRGGWSEEHNGSYLQVRGVGDGAPYGFWIPLRRKLMQVTSQQRQELLESAQRLRPTMEIYERCRLTFLFPERQDWVAIDIEQARDGDYAYDCLWGPALCLQDREFLLELWREFFWQLPPALTWTLLHKLGEEAVPEMLELVEAGEYSYLEPLSIVGLAEVADLMKARLEKSSGRKTATEFFSNFPELAFPRLSTSKARSTGASLLEKLCQEHPALAVEAARGLEGSPRKRLEGLLATPSQGTVHASPEECPGWLLNPPWRAETKTALVTKLPAFAVLDSKEKLRWKVDFPRRSVSPPTRDDDQAIEEMLETGLDFDYLDVMTDETALRVFSGAKPQDWIKPNWDKPLYWALDRLGLELIPAFLSLGQRFPNEACWVLSQIESPRVALFWAQQLDSKTNRVAARGWLEAYPDTAALGLVPIACSEKGKAQRVALQALVWLRCEGHHEVLEQVVKRYGPKVEKSLTELIRCDPTEFYPLKFPTLPDFWQPQHWPRPVLRSSGRALPLGALQTLGQALAFDQPFEYPGLTQIKPVCVWDDFLWGLFKAWEQAGAPSRDNWAFFALGRLGGESVVRELYAKIRQWPQQSYFARAVTGLEVLTQIGTDQALMYLHELSKTLKSEALRGRAAEELKKVGARRGLTADQLEDRLFPSLGLDHSGSLLLDFGARQFEVGFDEQLRPLIRDQQGRLRKSLPKPGRGDDPKLVDIAAGLWNGLKKDVKKLAHSQIARLEVSMVNGRRWKFSEFQEFLVEHPLLIHLVRRLIWGHYRDDGLQETFRVCEDKTLADRSDQQVFLNADDDIGLPHPLELDTEEWTRLLVDYQLIQPFEQLQRQTYPPLADELGAHQFERLKGTVVQGRALLRLKSRGWRPGPVEDGARIINYWREFGRGREVVLSFEPGLGLGGDVGGDQTLGAVLCYNHAQLESLSASLFSEVVRDLHAVGSTLMPHS